jgi:hypothetical protein
VDGYGHDWGSIQKLLKLKQIKNEKIKDTSGYIVCHIPGKVDL